MGSHLAVIAYSTRGTHILYHDRGVIHILLRQRAGRGGKAEADREAVQLRGGSRGERHRRFPHGGGRRHEAGRWRRIAPRCSGRWAG